MEEGGWFRVSGGGRGLREQLPDFGRRWGRMGGGGDRRGGGGVVRLGGALGLHTELAGVNAIRRYAGGRPFGFTGMMNTIITYRNISGANAVSTVAIT